MESSVSNCTPSDVGRIFRQPRYYDFRGYDFGDSPARDQAKRIDSSRPTADRPKADPLGPPRARRRRSINDCAGEGGQNTAEMESIRAARCQGLPEANFNFDTDRPRASLALPFPSLSFSVSRCLSSFDKRRYVGWQSTFMRFDRSPASNEVGDPRTRAHKHEARACTIRLREYRRRNAARFSIEASTLSTTARTHLRHSQETIRKDRLPSRASDASSRLASSARERLSPPSNSTLRWGSHPPAAWRDRARRGVSRLPFSRVKSDYRRRVLARHRIA